MGAEGGAGRPEDVGAAQAGGRVNQKHPRSPMSPAIIYSRRVADGINMGLPWGRLAAAVLLRLLSYSLCSAS